MNVHCLGISHLTAPIEIRERMWFSIDEVRTILPSLRENQFAEVVLISTCNRTELYYVPGERLMNGESPSQVLARFKQTEGAVLEKIGRASCRERV